MKDVIDDSNELINGGEVPRGQRQKEYRAAMKAKGFVCKQLWVPKDRVEEIERLVLDMRKEDDDLI